jgi:5'-nucleotidase
MTKSDKLHILLDMDGVIAAFHQLLLKKYNQLYNNSYTLDDCKQFEFSKCLGVDVWDKMLEIYNAPGFYSELEVVPGAIKAVDELLEIADVEICSALIKIKDKTGKHWLNADCAACKINWIHKHFPKLSESITLTTNKFRYKADILIDDALHNIRPWCLANPEGLGVIINQPWNQTDTLPKNCARAIIEEVPNIVRKYFSMLN